MKKVLVIGCPGSGKSTFARKLSAATGLPLHYLDMIWHRPDRTTLDRDTFIGKLKKIVAGDEWIIDGNYLHTLPLRLDYCDTIFFFDLPVEICLAGAEERVGKVREDMPWIEQKMDEEFRQWILDFPVTQLPEIRRLLSENKRKISIVEFRARSEADRYVELLQDS